MVFPKFSVVAVAALLGVGTVAVLAQEAFVAPATPEEAVTMRKNLMREDGGILRQDGVEAGADIAGLVMGRNDDATRAQADDEAHDAAEKARQKADDATHSPTNVYVHAGGQSRPRK